MRVPCEDLGQWGSWDHILIRGICVTSQFGPLSVHGDVYRSVTQERKECIHSNLGK